MKDEIMRIASEIVLKNNKFAEKNATLESEKNYLKLLDEEDTSVTVDNYVEMNNYYRWLMGLSSYGFKPEVFNGKYVSRDFNLEGNMSELEMYEFINSDDYENFKALHPTVMYLRYIKNPIDFMIAREADPYTPLNNNVDTSTIESNVYEILNKRVRYFKRWIVNSFMDNMYEYYEPMISVYIIMSTVVDMLNYSASLLDIEMLTDSDIYNIFKSYDLPYFELPRSIRLKMIERIDLLVKSASTKNILVDIEEIFGSSNVYKYLLYKSKIGTDDGAEINFVKVPASATQYGEYLNNSDNIFTYEEIVRQDPLWNADANYDFTEELDDLKHNTIFTIMGSKYMSIENVVDISKSFIDFSLFINHIFNNEDITKGDLGLMVFDNIETNIFDFVAYTTALINKLNGYEDTIPHSLNGFTYIYGISEYKVYSHALRNFRNYILTLPESDTRYSTLNLALLEAEAPTDVKSLVDIFVDLKSLIEFLNDRLLEITDLKEYEIVYKLYKAITAMKTNAELFDNALTYTEYLKLNNIPLYLKTIGEIDSDDVELCIQSIESLVRSEDTLKNMTEAMRGESQNLIRQALYQMIKIFKSHTVDLLENRTLYVLPQNELRIGVLDAFYQYVRMNNWFDEDYEHIIHGSFNKRNIINRLEYTGVTDILYKL